MQTLPPPDADALAHSAHLREVIQEQMIAAGGSLPFWKFMELALYAPGLGYYSAGAHKFGPGGDFTTAPELSPLFTACVADALTPVLQQLGPDALFVEDRFVDHAHRSTSEIRAVSSAAENGCPSTLETGWASTRNSARSRRLSWPEFSSGTTIVE